MKKVEYMDCMSKLKQNLQLSLTAASNEESAKKVAREFDQKIESFSLPFFEGVIPKLKWSIDSDLARMTASLPLSIETKSDLREVFELWSKRWIMGFNLGPLHYAVELVTDLHTVDGRPSIIIHLPSAITFSRLPAIRTLVQHFGIKSIKNLKLILSADQKVADAELKKFNTSARDATKNRTEILLQLGSKRDFSI